ncbi:MAG: fused MFS/spermidine synthase [Anaerolineae bacterium]|nr:fused MFS/spermidine synthase [Anaerolineae bacterium]
MAIFSSTVFLSAFLLFLVQPLISKYILPWFGGAPAVWSSAMLFFQTLLLAGYSYSHGLAARLPLRVQGRVHLGLLGLSLVVFLLCSFIWQTPITPGAEWQPRPEDDPIVRILTVLAVSVGLPYLTLTTTGPLLQAWFSRVWPGRSPYRLYALSNVGSLLALVCYPVLIEPLFTVRVQAMLWSAGYLLFVLNCGYLARRLMRLPRQVDHPSLQSIERPAAEGGGSLKHWPLWLGLSACASLLLLATTNQMTQDIAAIPFLWVLPLTLYLLSFILCFAGSRWYSRGYVYGLLVLSLLYCWVLIARATLHIIVQLAVHALLLFCVCMVCHGEMVRLRPPPEHLTAFYLIISLGGALGSVFVNLIAPLIFNNFWELPLGLVLCWLLLLAVLGVDRSLFRRRRRGLPPNWAMAATLAAVITVSLLYVQTYNRRTLYTHRNFYGVLWVAERPIAGTGDSVYELAHGAIMHGAQYTSGTHRREPISYYRAESGGGLALRHSRRDADGLRVGVLGLGIGTLAAYGQPGDIFRFYEINPAVIRLAEGEGGYFSYLADSPAHVEIVSGDGRLAMARELETEGPQHYDVLVLDAFSGDAVPVHLLTRESFALYLNHLAPDGVLVVNISNRHLDLRPVVARLAAHFGLHAALVESPGDGRVFVNSTWVLATRNKAFLEQPEVARYCLPLVEDTRIRLWTDDYSNLFQILYW